MNVLPSLETRVANLLSDYCHCIDDERYEEWPDFFTDACRYRINTRQNVKRGWTTGLIQCESKGMLVDRVNSLRHANIYEPHHYRHLLGPTRPIGRPAASVQARTGFAIIRIMSNGNSDLFLTGVYEDEIVDVEGQLKFQERIVVLDSSRIDTLIVIPV